MVRRKVKPLSAPGSPRMGRSLKDGAFVVIVEIVLVFSQ